MCEGSVMCAHQNDDGEISVEDLKNKMSGFYG